MSKVKVAGMLTGQIRLTMPPAGTIRNPAARVGRNEPCPCGSKKKYKNCCGRHDKPHAPPRLRDVRPTYDISSDDELVTQDVVSTGEVTYDVFTQLHQMIVAECPEGVYAYLETGRIIPDASRANYSSRELIPYDDALRRWYAMQPAERDQHIANWARYCAEPATFADRQKQDPHGSDQSSPSE